ncbi:recombination-associated protein RdgC [Methylomagnum ishizawai]|uniref:recombination-associated protein RdgC n=1 Tax=Methylomagnum ishizawai TaxID=1760988 RepID=UPI001C33D3D9|nr:recombination-associated protein RdgC [Methylomagnum ishizawai]BBL75474.1 recombination-associated protein RdgC [Methylomagnum ishizawai]
MFFKNLLLFLFTESLSPNLADLEERLQQRRFQGCGSLELSHIGWVPPVGKGDSAPLVHATNGFLMVCLRREEKILPASVVNEVLADRVEEIESRRGTPVRRKEKDALRDEVMQDLLPRAFVHSKRAYAYIDPKGGWLVVDSASAKKADELTGLLRQCLGSLPIVPFATMQRPSVLMTSWLGEDGPPTGVTLDTDAELRSPEEDGGTVRCRNHDLGAPEIQNHLEAGKEAVKLALTYQDRLSLVLDESLTIKRLRFLDLVQEKAAEVDTDDPAERFDADFAVMALELAEFLPALAGMFGGANVEGVK